MSKKKSKKVGAYRAHDPYFQKAKQLGYRARSAFKLLELQEKFELVKPDMHVLDIGCAPGSFLQVISKITGDQSTIVGVDIQAIDPLPGVTLIQEDIFNTDALTREFQHLGIHQFHLITSDIAPKTSGHTGVDQYKSVELNCAILDLADIFLEPGGNLLLKVFVGEDVDDLIGPIKQRYKKLRRYKPHACRDRSFEEYFVCFQKL